MASRRGNTLVLVVGLLVLLVIIATSYLTRTHAARVTAVSRQRTALRDDNARSIAETLAAEIAEALFVRPVSGPAPGDANTPRLPPEGPRYGVDGDHPYNFAPYQVVPYTNWPDGGPLWPRGPGAPLGMLVSGESNPVGPPGFGDARWLADLEPMRWDTDADGTPDALSHWRHLANIARAGNGWRICRDISDVTGVTGGGGLVTDVGLPGEQWLARMPNPALFDPATGNAVFDNGFFDRWADWFDSYAFVYRDPARVPPNLYDLRDLVPDLDGDGVPAVLEPGERPQDAFEPGTARHSVGRILADADGDGFTDSFWFLAPTMIERGVRQVVAVRIVDNGAMLDVNTATRFVRNDLPGGPARRTRGQTPADVALVGEARELPWPAPGGDHFNVGFFDNPAHWFDMAGAAYTVIYDDAVAGQTTPASLWANHVQAVGLPAALPEEADRLDYWLLSGRTALGASPFSAYTPYGVPEELELRMFHGNNHPWILSRLEQTTQDTTTADHGFLHGQTSRAESSEYLDRLHNRDLLREPRHRLTAFSGARNDVMPAWLWPRDAAGRPIYAPVDIAGDGVVDEGDVREFEAGIRKYDLRGRDDVLDVDRDGIAGEPDDDLNGDGVVDRRDHVGRLRDFLRRALIGPAGDSYHGDAGKTNRMAAAFAANIAEYRDADRALLLGDAVPVAGAGARFMGMEPQPFLVESVVAHVYEANGQAQFDHVGVGDIDAVDAGDRVICGADPPVTTIVGLQIANPCDVPIDLSAFELGAFGQAVALPVAGEPVLLPPGDSRVYYSMEAPNPAWRAALGIDLNDGDGDGIAAYGVSSATWSPDRDDYDGAADRGMELRRRVPDSATPIVIDRIDVAGEPGGFGDAVADLLAGDDLAETGLDPCAAEPPAGVPWNVRNLGSGSHLFQMVTATRAWELDADGSGAVEDDERNPRYVFASRRVDLTPWIIDDADPPATWFTEDADSRAPDFDDRDKDEPSVSDDLAFPMQMLHKDADFEQVGELLNVWLFGHELSFIVGAYAGTATTFSEFMRDEIASLAASADRARVNRLRFRPVAGHGQVVGAASSDPLDPAHAAPGLPAAARVLEAFVCDGPGVNGAGAPRLANGFQGKATPGLININTAPPEVLEALPHLSRLVHADPARPLDLNPSTRLAQAVVRYRDWLGDPTTADAADPADDPPAYGDRSVFPAGGYIDGLHHRRGCASIGELLLLLRAGRVAKDGSPPVYVPGATAADVLANSSFRVDYLQVPERAAAGLAGAHLFPDGLGAAASADLSTDVIGDGAAGGPLDDDVAEDNEEANLLFAGCSNLVTTRSDVFTVYFRVRSFVRDPVTGRWDATDPEQIVDDARYVMLVDRAAVERPDDAPRIVYLEKLPP